MVGTAPPTSRRSARERGGVSSRHRGCRAIAVAVPGGVAAAGSVLARVARERREAHEPPESRGLRRDEVRMLVAEGDALIHARARDLPDHLRAGDVLVVNTSATLPAALPARRAGGERWAAPLDAGARRRAARRDARATRAARARWVVELRRDGRRFGGGRAGEVARAARRRARDPARALSRPAAVARRARRRRVLAYLARHGSPIRYAHTRGEHPLDAYQTVFALHPGSAEMPSAARPFTPRARHGARRARDRHRAADAARRRVLARGRRAPYPERFAVPPRPRGSSTRRAPAAAASSPSARRRAGARDRRAAGASVTSRPSPAGRATSSRRRPASAPSTACSPGGTTPTRRTCSCSRPSPGASSSSAPTKPRSTAAIAGTSSATSTSSCLPRRLSARRRGIDADAPASLAPCGSLLHPARLRPRPRAGEVHDDEVVSFVVKRETVLERLRTSDYDPAIGDPLALSDVTLLAPVPRPRAIFGIGLNYAAHAAEQGKEPPEFPIVFMKLPSRARRRTAPSPARTSSSGWTTRASSSSSWAPTRRSPATRSPTTVSARDLQRREPQWTRAKGADGFCPWGPWITTADKVQDPGNLRITTHVNGELRQDSSTADLIFGPQELVDFISETCTLEPGDLILTGTPSGVGMSMDPRRFLQSGDVVRIEIETLGAIEHAIA